MRNLDSKVKDESRMAPSREASGAYSSRNLCFILQRASLVISRQLDDALRPIGLTSRQLMILGTIAEQSTLRQAALADVLGKDRTTVTANLGPLIKRGWVLSVRDHDDRRARRIALTSDGDRLLDRGRGLLRRFDAELRSRIQRKGGTKDLRAAVKILSQLSAAHRASTGLAKRDDDQEETGQ